MNSFWDIVQCGTIKPPMALEGVVQNPLIQLVGNLSPQSLKCLASLTFDLKRKISLVALTLSHLCLCAQLWVTEGKFAVHVWTWNDLEEIRLVESLTSFKYFVKAHLYQRTYLGISLPAHGPPYCTWTTLCKHCTLFLLLFLLTYCKLVIFDFV